MTLYAADGSSFTWDIAKSELGGFDASFRIERRADGQVFLEGETIHALSRETAIGWLRVQATIRGFDGRSVK